VALARLATFLHAEWGDQLFPGDQPVDPICGRFYRAVADLVVASTAAILPDAPRVCDVGGGAGRFLFELARRSWGHTRLILAEPAGPLCEWAHRLLCGAPFHGLAPVVTRAETVEFRRVNPADLPTPLPSAEIRQSTAAQLSCPDGQLDVVACLNVIDRVAQPMTLVAQLSRLVRRGGVLVLSSPFQFRAELTPRAHRLTDLRDLLPDPHWRILGDTPRLPYEFRAYDRGRISFDSQVVVAVKR
jgi:SAM-dependent methyltransferase